MRNSLQKRITQLEQARSTFPEFRTARELSEAELVAIVMRGTSGQTLDEVLTTISQPNQCEKGA
jgi:hypothetical protein